MPHRDSQQASLFDDAAASSGDGHAADARPPHEDGEARPGHRHVKRVGWIPEAWEVKRMQEIVKEIAAGRSVGGTDANINIKDDEKGVLRTSAVTSGTFCPEEHKVVDPEDHDRLKLNVAEGDILFNRANGSLELVGISVQADADYPNLFLSDKLWRIRAASKTSPEWLHYALKSDRTMSRIRLYAGSRSTGMKNISQRDFLSIRAVTPPLPEQRRIAEILGTWDRALAQIGTLIAAKERRLRGLMQRLLTGAARFPEFEGEPWREVEMRQLGRIVTGGTPRTSDEACWGGEVAWCTPTDITALKGKLISETRRRLTEKGVRSSAADVLPPRSVIVCTRATIGDCAINAVPMATNQGFKSVVPNEKADADFLYYWFCHFKHKLKRVGSGSTFLEVSKKDFGRLGVDLPSLAEQRKIAAVLSAAEAEVEALRRQRAALQRQKKGVMQRLLTGAVRVK